MFCRLRKSLAAPAGLSLALGPAVLRCLLLLLLSNAAVDARAADEDKPTPPDQVTLRTGDNVALQATYYPSKLGKKAAAIVLLHASKGNRGDFEELSLKLQQAGHAVLAPDLRGHGDSDHSTGTLRAADYEAMINEDLEAVKRFLIVKNNAGELNIERLGVVGVEMGAVVALNWAALDWSWPMLNTGKQGQDVKAMVLVSPEWSFKGLRINEAVVDPQVRSEIALMVVAGRGSGKSLQEARRLYSAFEKYHPQPPANEAAEKQTLWLRTPQTTLQGTRLLNEKSLHVDQMILKFVELRLVKPPIPWDERRNPLP
jgi:pimeloyl-ACP methyl ester carboxylesterase